MEFENAWMSEYEKQCKADEAEAENLEEKCKWVFTRHNELSFDH